jgi:hypothetical protein
MAKNFKSNKAYKSWLAYGHASGEFAKTPGNQKVSIKGKPKKVKHKYGGPKYPSGPYYPYKGSTLRVNKSYDKNHVQPSVFNHGGPHIDPTALEQANANINTANTSASNYFSNPDNFASTQEILNEYANVGNYKPITYSGGFTNTGNTVSGGYNSPVNRTNTLTGGEFYNDEAITDLPIISYNDFTDKKGQHFYVPNYGIKTPTAPIDRNLATETAQRPVMQNVPLQTNKMKSKVKGANNKYMKNVGTKHFQTQALDEQGNPMMEDYSVFKQGDKTINERTYNTALRKQQGEQAAYETELLKAKEQVNKFQTYGGPMKKNYKNGGDKKKYIPTEKQQILIDKGLLSYKDALGGEGPKTNTAWENYTSKQGGTNIRQIQDSLIKQGLLTEEALKSDKGLWGDASEAAYQNFLNNTDVSGNDFLTSALPLNIASVVDDIGGNLLGTKKTDVFTANNLKQSEKDFMLNAARENLKAGKPYMEYADYKTHLNPDGTVKESAYKEPPSKHGNTRHQYFDVGNDRRTAAEKAIAEFDPGYNMKTHFGQSAFSVVPAYGDRMHNDTLVTDQYNFNNAGELTERDKEKLTNFKDPYGIARTLGKGYGSSEGEGRNSMVLLNNDNSKKWTNSNLVSDMATQTIGGPGLGLLKKGYDYFNKANGGNLYPYGGPTKDIKKLMIAEGINPEHYDKYKDTIDNIYTEIKKPGEYSPGFMDNLKIKAASKYYPNVNEIINKFDAGTFNMGGYMKYANGGQFDTGGQMGEFSGVPVTEFNNGGSHEANPLGGIPQGPGALVEEGELKLDLPSGEQFIVSPKIMYKKNDKEVAAIAQELGISEKEFKKFAGKDMVSVFKSLTRKNSFNGEKREGDTIQENSIEADIMPFVELHTFLTERKNAEEAAKKEQAFAQDMDMMMQEHPEYMQAMMAQQQQQQGPSPEEQAMMEQQMMQQQGGAPQGMPPMMGTYGGKMNPDGSVIHFNNGGYSYSDYLAPQQAMPVQGVAASGYGQGGMMSQQYKNGAGMKVAGNILSTASPFLSAIPVVGPILTPIAAGVGSGLTEAGNQKAENPNEKINIQDVATKTAIGAGASFIPGVGNMVGSMANKVYDETLDSSKKSQAEIQEILNNPEHPEYAKTLKSMQESAESNKGADLTNNIINTGMQVAGGIASNQANTAASNVEGMDAFAAAGGAPEGTTTGYSGGKFSGANDMGNYSSYAPGFTAGADGTAVPVSAGGGNANGGYMQYMNGGVINTPVNYNYGGRKQYVTGGLLLDEDPPVDLAATGINKNNFFQKLKFRDVSGKTVAKDSFIALEALSDYGFNPKDDTVLTSLTRTEELNKKVGGVSNSLHLTGKAMDVSSQGDSKEFLDWTNTAEGKKWIKDFNIDKVDETGKQGAAHWHFEFNDVKDTSSIKNYDKYATTFEDNKDANTGMINLDTYSSNPQVTKELQATKEKDEVNADAQDKINNMGQAAFDALPEEERKKLLSATGTSFQPTEEEQKLMEEKQAVLDEVVKEQALKLNKTPETVLKTLLAMDPAERDKMLDERLTKNLEENEATNTVTSPPVSNTTTNTTTNAPTNNAPGNLNPSKPIEDIDTDKLEEAELDAQTEAEMFADAPKSNFKEWAPKDWIEDGYDYTQDLDDTVRENQYLKPTLLENMIGAAPGIANIAMGLGKDDKLKLDRIDPISAKYISLDESRKANERLLAAQQAATKNVAGNAGGGNYLANMQATYLKYLQGMSGIDQQEQNANAQIGNQTAAQNAQIAAQNAQLGFKEQDYAARTKAAKQGMIGTGIGQIADVYQGNQQNKFMTNTYLPTVSPDYAQFYKWQKDPNKNWLGLNKKNKG